MLSKVRDWKNLDKKGNIIIRRKQEEAISKTSEAIKVLFDYTNQRKLSILAISISIVAIICSIGSLVFQFIK